MTNTPVLALHACMGTTERIPSQDHAPATQTGAHLAQRLDEQAEAPGPHAPGDQPGQQPAGALQGGRLLDGVPAALMLLHAVHHVLAQEVFVIILLIRVDYFVLRRLLIGSGYQRIQARQNRLLQAAPALLARLRPP